MCFSVLDHCQQWRQLPLCWLSCHVRAAYCTTEACRSTEDGSLHWPMFLSSVDRPLCSLWGECCWGRHWLHSHGPGLPRGVLHLHDVQQQAEGAAFLRSREESLLWTLLYCKYSWLFFFCLLVFIVQIPQTFVFFIVVLLPHSQNQVISQQTAGR